MLKIGASIVAARRSPIGSFLGSFKGVPAVELGIATAKSALAGVDRSKIADVIVGNVLQAGQGMNPARQVALGAGLPDYVPGMTVNRVCGSGLQAVISAVQGICSGAGKLYLAGGIENMSRAPYLLTQMRSGRKMGDTPVIDSMTHDSLTDPSHRYHMGVTAENIAAKYGITRVEQDEYAMESHQKAAAARASNLFSNEIVPVRVSGKKEPIVVVADESIRPTTCMEALGNLKPIFKPDGGTVTAGNASGLNDGAAMLVIAETSYAEARKLPILARIVDYAIIGLDPAFMGLGPSVAVPVAMDRAGLQERTVKLFELNEAFAAQAIAVCRNLRIDMAKVNVKGGAIALGHPIGASGARILVTLVHALRERGGGYGVASLCIGGGMGIAIVIEAA
ncbi:MAG: thiolase family protein [Acidobacteriaceae bacterium]